MNMMNTRKKNHNLDRTTELYEMCDKVNATMTYLNQEETKIRDTATSR
jgi:hypothetical protein